MGTFLLSPRETTKLCQKRMMCMVTFACKDTIQMICVGILRAVLMVRVKKARHSSLQYIVFSQVFDGRPSFGYVQLLHLYQLISG